MLVDTTQDRHKVVALIKLCSRGVMCCEEGVVNRPPCIDKVVLGEEEEGDIGIIALKLGNGEKSIRSYISSTRS